MTPRKAKFKDISAQQPDDQVVKELQSGKFPDMPNTEALDVALALQQLLRGQSSVLENQERLSREMETIRKRMAKYDSDAKRYETDRKKFVEEVMAKAEKLRATGLEKDKIIAKGSKQFSEAMAMAHARKASEDLAFAEELKNMPRVKVMSPGRVEMVIGQGGSVTPQVYNEEIRIRNKRWILPAGEMVEVPQIVADELKRRRMSAKMDAELRAAMAANLESDALNARIVEIRKKYNENIRTAGEAEGDI